MKDFYAEGLFSAFSEDSYTDFTTFLITLPPKSYMSLFLFWASTISVIESPTFERRRIANRTLTVSRAINVKPSKL